MIIQRLKNFLISLLAKERSPHKLALSLSVGIYIAFSPFIGFHTLITVLVAWALRLNFAVIWLGSHVINNPWTMIPVYAAGYWCGDFLLNGMLGLDMLASNPSWMTYINNFLINYLGITQVSLWSFLIGGNLLGLCAAFALYPVFKRVLTRLAFENQGLIS